METKNWIQRVFAFWQDFFIKTCSFVAGIFKGSGAPESEKRVIAFLFSVALIVLIFLAMFFSIKSETVVTQLVWCFVSLIALLLGLATVQDILTFVKGKTGSLDKQEETNKEV